MEDIMEEMEKKMGSGGIIKLILFYWFIIVFYSLSLVTCRGIIWLHLLVRARSNQKLQSRVRMLEPILNVDSQKKNSPYFQCSNVLHHMLSHYLECYHHF